MGPVIASLFTGNAIVIQMFGASIVVINLVCRLSKNGLKLLNINEDLIQLCCCYPEDADYSTSHPGLSHITFIGSKNVAHKVVESAAKELTPCVVELGGKDSLIVLDDVVDLKILSSVIMRGTFQSVGQNCIGIERVICLPKAYETLVEILSERIGHLRLGSDIDQLDEIDLGAMISDNRFQHLEDLISDAVSKGARLIHGGKLVLGTQTIPRAIISSQHYWLMLTSL